MAAPHQAKSTSKGLFTILIGLALLYFGIGAIAVWWKALSPEAYAFVAGIVGSVASIIGLISLSRPAFTQADFARVEIESLRKIAETSEEVQRLEAVRLQEMQRLETTKVVTAEQIKQLEHQKQEMEFLVRKASLVLLLQEQHKARTQQVIAEVEKNGTLKDGLADLKSVDDKLRALKAEIEGHPYADLLNSVIQLVQRKDDYVNDFIDDLPVFSRIFAKVAQHIAGVALRH